MMLPSIPQRRFTPADQTDLRRRRMVFAGLATAGLTSCGGGTSNMPTEMATTALPAADRGLVIPTGGSKWPTLPLLANTATTGSFVAALAAAPATASFVPSVATQILAYNGGTPGPVIDTYEGDSVRIAFRNQIGQDSTVHWHGLPIPASQDGNPMDPVVSGVNRDYTFTLPIGSAGTYWYHPHPHGTTHEQVYRGLAGAFIVRGRNDPFGHLPERIVFITDLRLDANGQIAPDTAFDLANGREGNQVLVNGSYQPVDTVAPGTTERWRIFDATNARYTRLVLDGSPMVVVALDGCALASPKTVAELLLAPGQRAEVIVRAPVSSNQKLVLRTLTYARGAMVPVSPAVKLLEISTNTSTTVPAVNLPTALPSLAPLPSGLAITQSLTLSDMGMGMSMGMSSSAGRFTINGKVFDPARDDITMKAGVAEEWVVQNAGMMDHPLHIHGTSFQLVASNRSSIGSDPRFNAFMDVVNLVPGEQIRIRIRIDTPGRRMFHCHILEHEAQGMMGIINVLA